VGYQYRSVIFTQTPEQRATAEASKHALEVAHRFAAPIATAIEPLTSFYEAEEYHQRYFEKHPDSPACHF
jgi:peptide-methionine (S)-S-oxide reductase